MHARMNARNGAHIGYTQPKDNEYSFCTYVWSGAPWPGDTVVDPKA